jgi:hypothetical protein
MPVDHLADVQPDLVTQHRTTVVNDFFWIQEQWRSSDIFFLWLRNINDDLPQDEVGMDAPGGDDEPPEI